jgi:hypothetical protein
MDRANGPIVSQPCLLDGQDVAGHKYQYASDVMASVRLCENICEKYGDFGTYNPNQEDYDNDLIGYIGDDCVALFNPAGAIRHHTSDPACTCNLTDPENQTTMSFTAIDGIQVVALNPNSQIIASATISSTSTTQSFMYRLDLPSCWYNSTEPTIDITFNGYTSSTQPNALSEIRIEGVSTKLSTLFKGNNRAKDDYVFTIPKGLCQQGFIDVELLLGAGDKVKLSDPTIGYCRDTIGELCGNGVKEGAEQCEVGFGCPDSNDTCSACTCIDTVAQCSDRFVDGRRNDYPGVATESCDYNPDFYCTDGWGCTNQCGCAPICGDGRVAASSPEQCDLADFGSDAFFKCANGVFGQKMDTVINTFGEEQRVYLGPECQTDAQVCIGGDNNNKPCTTTSDCLPTCDQGHCIGGSEDRGACTTAADCPVEAGKESHCSFETLNYVAEGCAVCDFFCNEHFRQCQQVMPDLADVPENDTRYIWISNTNIDSVAQMIALQSEADVLNAGLYCAGGTKNGLGCVITDDCDGGTCQAGKFKGGDDSHAGGVVNHTWEVGEIIHEYQVCNNGRVLDFTNPADNVGNKKGCAEHGWSIVASNPSRIATNVEGREVWVGYRYGGGVVKFDEGTRANQKGFVKQCASGMPAYIRALAIDVQGNPWIGGTGNSNPGTRHIVQLDGGDNSNCITRTLLHDANTGEQALPYDDPSYGFAIDSFGGLWASGRANGEGAVYRYDIGDPTLFQPGDIRVGRREYKMTGPYLNSEYGIGVDLDDNAWVSLFNGLTEFLEFTPDVRLEKSHPYPADSSTHGRGVGISTKGVGNGANDYNGWMWVANDDDGTVTGYDSNSFNTQVLGNRGYVSAVSGDSAGYIWSIAHSDPSDGDSDGTKGETVCRSKGDGTLLQCFSSSVSGTLGCVSNNPLGNNCNKDDPKCFNFCDDPNRDAANSDLTVSPYIYSDFLGLNRALVFRKSTEESTWIANTPAGNQTSLQWGKLIYCSDENVGRSSVKVDIQLGQDKDGNGVITPDEIIKKSTVPASPDSAKDLIINGTLNNPPRCDEYAKGMNLDPGDTISQFNSLIDSNNADLKKATHIKLTITRQTFRAETGVGTNKVQVGAIKITCDYGDHNICLPIE